MKLICKLCGKVFDYPVEQITHRHKEVELDLVPPNFWGVKDYLSEFSIDFGDFGQVITPKGVKKSTLSSGNTPLICLSKNAYIKDESLNPTGSFKDRGMETLMNEVLMHKKNKIAVVSCGSGAISTIRYAKEYGIKSLVFVHKSIDETSKKIISQADEVFYSENFIKSYEDYMKYCLENDSDVFWGFLNTNISYMLGLRTLAYEIVRDLKDTPDVIVLPCGSGMNIVAQDLAFKEMYERKIISKMPKIAIVEIEGGNPIAQGVASQNNSWLHVIKEPVDSKTILSNDTCFNYKNIYEMVERGEGFFVSVNDSEIEHFICQNPEYAGKYDYTSLAVMPAINRLMEGNFSGKIVAVITCKNRNGGTIYE